MRIFKNKKTGVESPYTEQQAANLEKHPELRRLFTEVTAPVPAEVAAMQAEAEKTTESTDGNEEKPKGTGKGRNKAPGGEQSPGGSPEGDSTEPA